MSSVDPGGQVHRKLPNVFKQLPLLHGVILHSSTSIVRKQNYFIHAAYVMTLKIIFEHSNKDCYCYLCCYRYRYCYYFCNENTLRSQYYTERNKPKRNTVVYGRARLRTLSFKNSENEIFLPRSSSFKSI